MPILKPFPYQVTNVFFIKLEFSRINNIADPFELFIKVEAKVVEPEFPRVQYNLRLRTKDPEPIVVDVEVIGVYNYIGDKTEYDKELNQEFMEKEAIHFLFMSARQMISITTSQMGMQPVTLNIPKYDNVQIITEEKPDKE